MKTPRFWQARTLVSTALLPLSALYRFGAHLDRRCTKPRRAPLPVIAIGNVTAGGAGKTPTVLALIPLLQALGHTPHILTRGYAAHHRLPIPRRVTPERDWRDVGDEALLLAAAAPTWVSPNRLVAAAEAAKAGATVLVCDDALQHHALHKDISLLVIDGPYGIGNGRLLPAGPLRESLTGATRRCDAALLIGADLQKLTPQISLPLFAGALAPTEPTTSLQGARVLAFAGIGRPEKFYMTLRELGAEIVATVSFADHHAYRKREIKHLIAQAQKLGAIPITTAKDAVKIPADLRDAVQVLPVELKLENAPALQRFLAEKLARAQSS